MRVRERGAGLAALVDDQVAAGAVRVRAHALAPRLHRGLHLPGVEVGQRGDRIGRVDDHLVVAGGRLGGEQVGVRVRLGLGGVGRQRRVQVRHRRGRSSPACPAAPPFGRTAYTSGGVWSSWPGANGSRVGVDRRRRVEVEVAAGPVGAGGGDDRLQTRQRVDPQLAHVSRGTGRCRPRARPPRCTRPVDERRLPAAVDEQRHREELRDLQLLRDLLVRILVGRVRQRALRRGTSPPRAACRRR